MHTEKGSPLKNRRNLLRFVKNISKNTSYSNVVNGSSKKYIKLIRKLSDNLKKYSNII